MAHIIREKPGHLTFWEGQHPRSGGRAGVCSQPGSAEGTTASLGLSKDRACLQGQALSCGLLTVTVSWVIDPWAGVRPASLTQLGPVLRADCALGQCAHLESVLGAKAGNASGLLSESQFPLSGHPSWAQPTWKPVLLLLPQGEGWGRAGRGGRGGLGTEGSCLDKATSPGLKVTATCEACVGAGDPCRVVPETGCPEVCMALTLPPAPQLPLPSTPKTKSSRRQSKAQEP